MFAVYVKHAV